MAEPVSVEKVLAEYGPALMRVAMAYAGDAAEAQDLYQETCFAIWRALPSFRGESSLRTFVWRIAHNRGLSHRARLPRRHEDETALAGFADPAPPPDQVAGRRMLQERLLEAVRRLGDTHREVLLLSLEGLSQAEIGEVLGLTENAVAVRLNRARKQLRERLEPGRFDR